MFALSRWPFLALLSLATGIVGAASLADSYRLEDIAFPEGVPPEVGGLTFDSEGILYVVLRRGDVLTARPTRDPAGFPWKLFASGFHEGCGILALAPGRVLITQMAEMTEVTDLDGDGRADRFRQVTNDWGLSGNYHETGALCSDGQGGYFLTLGTASHNGPTFAYVQGDYSPVGRRGRNFSSSKYRGWILHYRADGTLEPYASGFRMHNGLLLDKDNNLWCSDNQGDWKDVTPFYHLRPGRFYGHPSSLVWDVTWPAEKDPLATYRADLAAYNAHRTYPAVLVPHLEICRSGAEPVQIPENGAFGPFAGQILLPDNNGERLARIMLEKVAGEYQGSVTIFWEGLGLRSGNNRTRFSPDGRTLYVGQTVRGWGKPAEGLQRFEWTGQTPFTIEMIRITPQGFRLSFTAPVNAAGGQKEAYAVRSMTFQPRWTYGSKPENERDETVSAVRVLGPREIEVRLAQLEAGRVYHLKLRESLKSGTNELPAQSDFYYTANRLPVR